MRYNSRSELPEIRRARAIAFSVTVCEGYGCPIDSRKVAACEAGFDITVLPGASVPPEFLRLWRRRFAGAVASESARAELYERLPHLRAIFDSSLWSLLEPSCRLKCIDETAVCTRINGKSLAVFCSKTLPLYCACPAWHRLAPLLAILRTQSSEWFFERMWLRNNFSAFCALMCLRPSHRKLAVPLWRAINILAEEGMLGELKHWPASEEYLEDLLQRQVRLGECLIREGWVSGWTDDCLVWLWHLSEPSCIGTVGALESAVEGAPVDKPAYLNMRVRREVAKMASTAISVCV